MLRENSVNFFSQSYKSLRNRSWPFLRENTSTGTCFGLLMQKKGAIQKSEEQFQLFGAYVPAFINSYFSSPWGFPCLGFSETACFLSSA
jgi:hypothetical protein